MNYVKRNEWDIVAPTNATPWDVTRLLGGGVHWFGIPDGPNDHSQCPAILRGVRSSHKNGEFNDIAYSHAVCQHGYVFELRGFGYQSGANGYADVNRNYYSVVCMLGRNDPSAEFNSLMREALRDIIAEWQRRGAGKTVTYHGYWTGSECPGSTVKAWVKSGLWKTKEDVVDPKILEWLDDWLHWYFILKQDPARRPAGIPSVIPQAAWDVAKMCHKISNTMGMGEGEEEWIKWRLVGGDRPQVPSVIPEFWWDDARRVHSIATAYAERT